MAVAALNINAPDIGAVGAIRLWRVESTLHGVLHRLPVLEITNATIAPYRRNPAFSRRTVVLNAGKTTNLFDAGSATLTVVCAATIRDGKSLARSSGHRSQGEIRMKTVFRVGLATFALVVLWVVVVFIGISEGWWKRPLATRGDTAAFTDAAIRLVDSSNKGNAVFAVIHDGVVHGIHAVSVGEPVNEDTVFQAASLSKWITAWGVMALVEEGKLDLDAPVGKYLTRWKLPESKFDNDKVTVRRLLSHTAGLTDGLGYAGFAPGTPVQSLEESLSQPADASPGASGTIEVGLEPGSEWRYSGGGYAILQLLIEEVSGESFEDYMQRAVFRPLGMAHSSYYWTPAHGSTLAAFYDADSKPATHYRFSAVAAVSLYTTVSDVTRFVQAHLPGKHGEPIGRGALGSALIEEMWRPHASRFAEDIWGLGTILYAGNNQGGFVVGHDGDNEPAINTAARFNPATGNGIVILETGTRLLATRLAGEWVFWETGNVDILAFSMSVPRMLRLMAIGGLAIILTAPTVAWLIRRKRRHRGVSIRAA
jgi:CubicO group peptidase (beta-lactamase class C family)